MLMLAVSSVGLAVVVSFFRWTCWISEFEPLQIGMSQRQVIQIVGHPAEISEAGGEWTYLPIDYGEPIWLIFDQDKLINANYPLKANTGGNE